MNLHFGVRDITLNAAEPIRGEVRDELFQRVEPSTENGRGGRDRQLKGLLRRGLFKLPFENVEPLQGSSHASKVGVAHGGALWGEA